MGDLMLIIDPMNTVAAPDGNSWTALGNDTTGLTTDLDHVYGVTSLEFDKVDGAANTKFGGIQRTLLKSININAYAIGGMGWLMWSINVQAKTNVDYAFIRLGTSSSHYNEWRVDASELETYWNLCQVTIVNPSSSGALGNGWNPEVVKYIAIGLAFDGETDALADIRVDQIVVQSGIVEGAFVDLALAAVGALLKLTPVNEVAVKLSVTTANQTETVVANGTVGYIIAAVDGVIFAGFNGTVVTEANRAWTIPAGQERLIVMPSGETTLNYVGSVNCTGYMQKVNITS